MPYSLKEYNSFRIEAYCDHLIRIKAIDALVSLLKTNNSALFILGEGSNVLLPEHLDKLVLKNEISGKKIVKESDIDVVVEIGGGENWHQFVMWCLDNNYYGLENLSLIPGTVGAAPMQNIGAYGVELKDHFEQLEAIEISTCENKTFDRESCQFGYRSSVFKLDLKDKYFITRVQFRLSKIPQLCLNYGGIKRLLKEGNINDPSARDISNVVIALRQSKLADPELLGNAGSFFKNPIVSVDGINKLKQEYPEIPNYLQEDGNSKLSAGWLIEQCGWKGAKSGAVGCFEKHALILVNYGGASSTDIKKWAIKIQNSVSDRFGIILIPEVNYIE